MDFHADDDFPVAGRALDELLRIERDVHWVMPRLQIQAVDRGARGVKATLAIL